LALLRRAADPGPACAAGHSLGELTALVAAGALGEEDGLRLVVLRGRLMDEAGQQRPGGMLAVGNPADAEQLAGQFGLAIANDNAPRQVVLAGDDEAVDAAAEEARATRVRAKRLPVRAAFHSPAMAPAVEPFAAALAEVEIGTPRYPVFSATTARPFDDLRRQLAEAITAPVRWQQVVRAMHAAGVDRFVEVGPGRVLTGLARRIVPAAEATTIASAAEALLPVR
jgi:[acyl-carrier-protein] S-malonyltransferase